MTSIVARRRGGRGIHPHGAVLQPRPEGNGRTHKRKALPEYLEAPEVQTLIHAAPHPKAALLMLLQWRAGLLVSEALAVEMDDLKLDGDQPTLRVRRGKGGEQRLVPVHPELGAALRLMLAYAPVGQAPLIDVHRATAWRWVKDALSRAQAAGSLPEGRVVGTHTLRQRGAALAG